MSNIYFMCENCGIETNGITFVNGMKFCAKCYHQIFGKDNQQTEITQLKQQLDEKDKEIERLKSEIVKECKEHQDFIKEAKQITNQLKSNYQTQLAIQELEKVIDYIKEHRHTAQDNRYIVYVKSLKDQINKQIKELKGEKDE